MAGTIPLCSTLQTGAAERVSTKSLSIPWYIWCNVIAVSSSVIGGVWDISWHESVGRDTFWTPAHMLTTNDAGRDSDDVAPDVPGDGERFGGDALRSGGLERRGKWNRAGHCRSLQTPSETKIARCECQTGISLHCLVARENGELRIGNKGCERKVEKAEN